jgi:hypothetical protein
LIHILISTLLSPTPIVPHQKHQMVGMNVPVSV